MRFHAGSSPCDPAIAAGLGDGGGGADNISAIILSAPCRALGPGTVGRPRLIRRAVVRSLKPILG